MFRTLPAVLLGIAATSALAGCDRPPAEVAPVLGRLVDGLEHGTDRHGHTLFNSLLAVATPVSQTDIPQTVLDLAGLPTLPAADGRSVRPEIEGRDPHKLIQQLLPEPREMLFDIRRDMAERNDLAGEAPDTLRELRRLLAPFVESAQWGYHLVATAPAEGARHLVVRLEPSRSGALRLLASTLPAQRGPASEAPVPGTVQVTYQRTLAAGATAPVDPELREKMRALGYVQ